MNEIQDRRILKTQSALLSAFLKLILEQGYEKLKVASVAELANVGRSTFYEHYRTKRDLLKASVSQPFAHLADLADPDADISILSHVLVHFRDQNQIARTLLSGPTRPILSAVLASLVSIRLKNRSLAFPLIASEILARQIADAQLSLLEVWVSGRPACGLENIVRALKITTVALIDSVSTEIQS